MALSNAVSQQKHAKVLLEAGTNEVEVFEFQIGEHCYGINVAKVHQLIQRDQVKITRADMPPPGVLGSISFRGKPAITLDLKRILGIASTAQDPERALMLVAQFNEQLVAFPIDAAEQIHRVSWKRFEPLSPRFSHENPFVSGIIQLQEKLILVLDLEYALNSVCPSLGIRIDPAKIRRIEENYKPRDLIKILYVEDSPSIRNMVAKQLASAGFTQIELASNGRLALDRVLAYRDEAQRNQQPLSDHVDLILTDIEMPVMDGLSFCRAVKQDLALDVPVIVFSSLINEQMISKCRSVGADAWGSKPKVEFVVALIDRHCAGSV